MENGRTYDLKVVGAKIWKSLKEDIESIQAMCFMHICSESRLLAFYIILVF